MALGCHFDVAQKHEGSTEFAEVKAHSNGYYPIAPVSVLQAKIFHKKSKNVGNILYEAAHEVQSCLECRNPLNSDNFCHGDQPFDVWIGSKLNVGSLSSETNSKTKELGLKKQGKGTITITVNLKY